LVAQYFSDLGARVLDADDLARAAIERGSSGFDDVVTTFGDSILRDGQIDRRLLAEKIFSDSHARSQLEAIIHPRVREGFELAAEELVGDEVLIYEIPLLVETNAKGRFDFIITVESETSSRIERLRDRGMSVSEIQSRMAAQSSSAQRREIADCVMTNDGSADDLLRQVEDLWENVLPALQREKRPQ
jgi:dephospho-CoA kinase